ncbi:hypothetical protein J3R82DRAFT_8557 [Butyriboletus roseoflavus]|nr:hypothetical protein J3R82DRAFT_8557 [Butyriboletus roseoflavus]
MGPIRMWHSTSLSLSLVLLSWVVVVRSQNCQLQVPANSLTVQGLATPYVLTGCNQLDFANQGAFVEAAILDPATGNIQIYNPLVINSGMTPVGNGTGITTTSAGATTSVPASLSSTNVGATTAPTTSPSGVTSSTDMGATTAPTTSPSDVPSSTIASLTATATNVARQAASAGFYIPPIVPTLPNNAVVGIWFGSNAASLTLTGSTDGCVNGLGNSVFGQFAYCNGQAWFNAAKSAVSQGLINLPAPGTGSGQACPTTHDFRVVDQDQSDNVVTTYLLIGGNTLAQNTPANSGANPNAEVLSNASDNALITQFIDPALGCAPYQNPCTTCPNGKTPALATDELVAHFFPPAGGPALLPLNDPMVLVNGQQSLQKVNLYRDGTGQPQADNNNASGLTYCQQFSQSGIFNNNNQQLFTNSGSPAPGMANNLFTFLAMRFSTAFGPTPGLGCTGLLNVANPVTLTMDGNGVVTAATINTQALQQILGGTGGATTTAMTALAASTSAATTAAGSATTASPTGVLLHLTSSTSSIPSAGPTSAAGNTTSGTAALGAQTSAAGSTMPQVSTATASSIPTCTNAATATVTVTATVCPTQVCSGCIHPRTNSLLTARRSLILQTLASSAPSASPTATSDDGWNDGWSYGKHYWKRSSRFMRRKSRMARFD